MHAARGTTLHRLGQRDAAKTAYERAVHLAVTEADRRFLAQQIEDLAEDEALMQHSPSGSTGPSNDGKPR